MRLVRLAVAVATTLSASTLLAQDEIADSLVTLWIDSLGGLETYHGFRSAQFTLTTELYDAASGRLKRTRPRYVTIAKTAQGESSRLERWEGSDYIEQGFDGVTVWAHMNSEALPDTAKDMREALYVSRDVFYWFGLPFKLRDPGVFLRYRGRDDAGRHKIAIQFGEGVGEHQYSWFYYFVDGAAWPVEVQYIEEGRDDLNRTHWTDISYADGYPYVARRVWVNAEGTITKILRMSDVNLNPELPPTTFTKP